MIQATNSLIYCKKRIHGTSANDNGDITEGLVAYESNQMIFSIKSQWTIPQDICGIGELVEF